MTDKQLIIDGVDVSECNFCEWKSSDIPQCRIRLASFESTCKGYNCHYKQLKLKEQKYEELKKELEAVYDDCKGCLTCNEALYNANLYAKEYKKLKQTLAEIKEIAEPYKMIIKKICGNCKKYDDCHACCYKDINCYKYTSSKTNACEEFTYLDEFVPNILANNILQKISEVIPNEN